LYPLLKQVHLASVAATFVLFTLRGTWMMLQSPHLQDRWVRILPHLVDSLLLASAIGMLLTLQLNPFTQPWLLAKMIALAVYILLGTLALKRAPTQPARIACFGAALLVFFYIVGVALTKSPMPGFH